ncbi:hypothetical protein KC330_g156 [Hortaea werneckii]|nr:hypothetical protein KC330_g156 [Hortaea werneckii]
MGVPSRLARVRLLGPGSWIVAEVSHKEVDCIGSVKRKLLRLNVGKILAIVRFEILEIRIRVAKGSSGLYLSGCPYVSCFVLMEWVQR